MKEFARILRKTEQKTFKILQILIEKGVASGSVLDNQNVTIINRRMVDYDRISQLRQEVGKKGGNPQLLKSKKNLDNQNDNQKRPSSSSLSSSLSSSKKQKNIKNIKNIYGSQFCKVKLTDDEHQKLLIAFGEIHTQEMIDNMDLYLESKGDKYKSHYATLLSWEKKNTGGNDGSFRSSNQFIGKTSAARNLGDGNAYPVDLEVTS
ncbi:MAG: hypothetical protein V1848_02410 [Candidatus Magasanikbacteria bacterium]